MHALSHSADHVQLLNLPSSDLDVALNIPSGWAFATEFVDYLHAKGVHTGSVGRVAANPEQSKHLETGTTTILGLDCDFVGLRSESYADSRIPHLVVSAARSVPSGCRQDFLLVHSDGNGSHPHDFWKPRLGGPVDRDPTARCLLVLR
jgi:phenylpropionate dioxygenase-like ring-hydroxylating dioxygenase large terminal subunit